MKVHLVSSLFVLFLLSFLISCTDNNDDYYKRPDWLEPPVYEVLRERGNFTMYLQAVDKTLYNQVVRGSGNYTVFAPNDDAFQKFLNEKGYKSVDEIPVAELNKIIGYSLVYNKFEYSRLGDAIVSNAWVEGTGMRKMTSYYKTIYKEKVRGAEHWVVDIDNKGSNVNIYTPYRGIPIFTSSFMNSNSLGELDYTAFYPQTNYTGANVAAGEIVNRDIYAENGIIHEVSAVPYPLKNLDEMLNGDEKYSKFREFLYYEIAGTPRYVLYEEDVALAEEYKKIYPDSAITTIFKKEFATIPYSLNRENYASNSLRYEQGGYTLIVPSNEAVEKFSRETLYKYTDNLELLPVEVFDYFLKAHMSDMLLWPSHYKMAQNSNGEYLNGEGRNGPDFLEGSIQKAVMASNGFFYYTDDVIKSKYFETVYAEFLINPAFSWLDDAYSMALKTEFMKSKITSQSNVSYTLCLTPNTVLAADGFVYNSGDGSFTHSDGANVSTRLDRIIRQGVFFRTSAIPLEFKETLPEYNGYGFAVNQYGDMIRYRNENDKTYLQAIGNIIENQEVELTYNDTYNNGFVYTVDKALEYSARNTLAGDARWSNPSLYEFIQEYVAQNPEASLFLDYLKATRVSSDGNISGVGTGAYTILFPSNESIQKLIDQGVLVEPDSPKLNQTHAEYDNEMRNKVSNFVLTHFLSGYVMPDDGLPGIMISNGNYYEDGLRVNSTLRVTEAALGVVNERMFVDVSKQGGRLAFSPRDFSEDGKVLISGIGGGVVIPGLILSNYIGPRSVFHLIDGYLLFEANITE